MQTEHIVQGLGIENVLRPTFQLLDSHLAGVRGPKRTASWQVSSVT